jgi:tetratricopeptide (TPR) repeat protein
MGLKIATTTARRGRTPQRISLCMIMRDEEGHLARCLRSVEGVADEIVIVDTGSTDASVAIAESFGARVLHEPWRGDFAAPRNTAIDAATGDWILVLDADEELVDGHALRELLHDEDIEGYCLREVNFIGEELGIESVVNSAFRLFRNRPQYRYEGALHEQIMGKVDPAGGACTRFVGVEIHHYGYLEPTSRAKEKTDRNMAIVMEEVARKPKDSFTLFNAGVEYQRTGRFDEALAYFQRAFATLPSLRAYYASLLLRNIVATLHAMEREEEALDVLRDALEAYPDFTDLHYLAGQIHTSRREYREAVRSFRRAIELGDHGGDRYLAQAGMGSFYSWHALGALYGVMGDTHEAVRAYRRAVATARGFYAAPLVKLAAALLESDDPETVREYLTGILPEARRADSLRVLGQVFVAEGHPAHALACLEEARGLRPGDDSHAIVLADAHIRLGDAGGAARELATVAPGSASYPLACGKRVLLGVVHGDLGAAAEAADALGPVDDGLYTVAYRAAVAALAGSEPPVVPDHLDRGRLVTVVLELCGTLLDLGALDRFNALVPLLYALADGPSQVDEPLGRILFAHDFPEPAADRLLAAAQRDEASPEAYAELGHICRHRDMPEEAGAFFREALARDGQNMSRYLDLAGLHASERDYAAAGAVLREGLGVYPHSTVLRELRQTMAMLAQLPA